MSELSARELRLPQWAQADLKALRRRVADLERDVDALISPTTGPVVYDPYGRRLRYASNVVAFELSDGTELHAYIRRDGATEWLEMNTKHGLLLALPRASNQLWLGGKQW